MRLFKDKDVDYTFFEKAELEDPWTTLWVEDAVTVNNERSGEWAAVIKYIVKVGKEVFLVIKSFSEKLDYSVVSKPLYRI